MKTYVIKDDNGNIISVRNDYGKDYFDDIKKATIIKDINDNIQFIEDDDGKRWFNEFGDYHREDGPAIEHYTGKKEWWYRGNRIECSSQEEFERLIKVKAFW
jgi:hypothetical protein